MVIHARAHTANARWHVPVHFSLNNSNRPGFSPPCTLLKRDDHELGRSLRGMAETGVDWTLVDVNGGQCESVPGDIAA